MNYEKMEQFKNNLEGNGFSQSFIKKSLEYFNELEEEKEAQELINIEEVIQYYSKINSFTCDILQSEENLKDFRGDITILKEDYPDLLDLDLYFKNIEAFEVSILYLLYYNFFPEEDYEDYEDDEDKE